MAEVKIEDYRGFEITFNTEYCTFSAWSNHYDDELTSSSFKGVRFQVDKFIKDNAHFQKFRVQKLSQSSYNVNCLGEPFLIIGIRKDKKPVYIGGDGKKGQ